MCKKSKGMKGGGRKREHYRFSEGKQNLPPQHMTVVRRGGAVHHDPVTVVELLDFKVSAELLQHNKHEQKREQEALVCLCTSVHVHS